MNRKCSPDWICPVCHDRSRKHMAKGLCGICYLKQYRFNRYKTHHLPPAPCSTCGSPTTSSLKLCKRCYMKKYRRSNYSRLYSRKCKLREIDRFGGRRSLIEKRAEGRCERCGIPEIDIKTRTGKRLLVHHKDGNGLNGANPNHAFENLMLLCIPCHRKIHTEMRQEATA